jgi:hypothetical protein
MPANFAIDWGGRGRGRCTNTMEGQEEQEVVVMEVDGGEVHPEMQFSFNDVQLPSDDELPMPVTVDSDDEGIQQDEFQVETILQKRTTKHGGVQYLVKWLGFPKEDNTWEPIENLDGCLDLVELFETKRMQKNPEARRSKRKSPPDHEQQQPTPSKITKNNDDDQNEKAPAIVEVEGGSALDTQDQEGKIDQIVQVVEEQQPCDSAEGVQKEKMPKKKPLSKNKSSVNKKVGGSKKHKNGKNAPVEVEPEPEYEVEEILDHAKRGTRIRYLVKWKGYDSDDNSWEPADNLLPGAEDLLREYKDRYGLKN